MFLEIAPAGALNQTFTLDLKAVIVLEMVCANKCINFLRYNT